MFLCSPSMVYLRRFHNPLNHGGKGLLLCVKRVQMVLKLLLY